MNITTYTLLDNAMVAVLLFCAWLSIKTCDVDERLAIIRGSRFLGLKGPGTFLHIPFYDRVVRVGIGDRFELQDQGCCEAHGLTLPVAMKGRLVPKTMVSVVGFTKSKNGTVLVVEAVAPPNMTELLVEAL